jgi:N-methylhydantoinase B/oxoprolinase/acetone carboxylase alpha subunit
VTAFRLKSGDTLQITVPNSGGYGDPVERDPELVLSDLLHGFTASSSRSATTPSSSTRRRTVDADATRRLRTERAPLVARS